MRHRPLLAPPASFASTLFMAAIWISAAPSPPTGPATGQSIPNIVSTSTLLTLWSKTGDKEAEVHFDSEVANDREAFFTNPRATFYTESGPFQIAAPRGKYVIATRILSLEGGVSATRASPPSSFSADSINYEAATRLISGDGALDLTWQGLHVTGKKFQMDVNAKTFIMEKEAKVQLAAQS